MGVIVSEDANVEVVVVQTKEEGPTKVKVGFLHRVAEWFLKTFGILERDETLLERSLRSQVESLKTKQSDLEFEIRKSQQLLITKQVAIEGLTEACVYHETRWRSLAKIEAIRARPKE